VRRRADMLPADLDPYELAGLGRAVRARHVGCRRRRWAFAATCTATTSRCAVDSDSTSRPISPAPQTRSRSPPTPAAPTSAIYTRRLHEGYRVVQTIEGTYDTTTAKAWLFGTNPRLADRAPIDVIAHATTSEQFADVRNAAHAFARQKRAERQ
jgi:hypothetical protein